MVLKIKLKIWLFFINYLKLLQNFKKYLVQKDRVFFKKYYRSIYCFMENKTSLKYFFWETQAGILFLYLGRRDEKYFQKNKLQKSCDVIS